MDYPNVEHHEISAARNALIVQGIDNFEEILGLINKSATQERRVFTLLNKSAKSATVDVNRITSTGNLSHIARKINKKIFIKTGYLVACEKPPKPILNQFQEKSDMYLWSIYCELPKEAANDDSL